MNETDLFTQLGLALGCTTASPGAEQCQTIHPRPKAYAFRVAQVKLDAERDYWAEIIRERTERYQGRFKLAERARSRARRERRRENSASIEDCPMRTMTKASNRERPAFGVAPALLE